MSDRDPVSPPVETLLCPDCRYDLAHLPTGNCPECGKAFTPEQVHAYWDERRLRSKGHVRDVAAGIVMVCLVLCLLPVSPKFAGWVALACFNIAGWMSLQRYAQGPSRVTFPLALLFPNLVFLSVKTFHDNVVVVICTVHLLTLLQMAACTIFFTGRDLLQLRFTYVLLLPWPILFMLTTLQSGHPLDTWSDFDLLTTGVRSVLTFRKLLYWGLVMFAADIIVLCGAELARRGMARRKGMNRSAAVTSL